MWYRPLLYVWVFPATAIGLLLVPFAVLAGGSAQVVGGVLEVQGGLVTRLLRLGLPWVGPVAALVLGHVVLGCDVLCLRKTREHERVHVRQYERWGPFFIPVYLLICLIVYVQRKDPYRDHPFEKQAREEA